MTLSSFRADLLHVLYFKSYSVYDVITFSSYLILSRTLSLNVETQLTNNN